jgi:hypothetical protein
MQLNKTIFSDSTIFIEKKRVENRLWRKSAFCGEKVENAGEKKIHHQLPRPERTTKPMSPHTIVSGLFNIPSPQNKSQKKNSTSDPSLN